MTQGRETNMNRKLYVASILIASSGFAFAGAACAADWTVAPETSSVGFTGTQQGTKFRGRFETFSASISFDPGTPEGGSIVGTVQTDSVNTRDHDRDATLLDSDWFDSYTYAEAQFESESIEALDDGSYRASGQLTLKGNTKPATMKFSFDVADDSSAKFAGQMKINRFDFKIGEGWNDTSWIAEDVDIQIELDLSH